MARDILMPQMGYDMTEGTIVRWVKKVGDRVHKGDIVAEIETDKATVEIEAFEAGTLLRIVAEPGETIPVGQPIATIGQAGEELPPPPGKAPAADAAPTAPPAPATPPPAAATPATPPATPAPATPAASVAAPRSPSAPAAVGDRPHASPLARRIATELGVDLARLAGSGPGGRITRADVEQAAATAPAPVAPAAAAGATPPVAQPAAPPLPEGAEDVEPSRLRQTVARRMTESKTTVPHFYVSIDINADGMQQVRERLAKDGVKVSLNDLIIRGLALAVGEHPEVNAAFIVGKIRRFKRIDIGVAIATDNGLMSPGLLDCGSRTVEDIAAAARDLAERARAGHLHPEELGGGTVTLSNLGMFGVDAFTAIINPPQALILAVGAARDRVVAIAGKPHVAKVMTAWASADHRVLDGADVARFLATLKGLLEDPDKLAPPTKTPRARARR